ncbi:MAG: alpha/beta fold hydrolase [Pseudomonadota bacterium]
MVANSGLASTPSGSNSGPVKLHASVEGEGSPLVLLHGLFGMGSNLGGISRALSDVYEVHQLDLPNHGRSSWTEDMNFAALAASIRAYIANACDGRAAVLGHSLGGKVAMQLAMDFPDAVSQLVLADIAPVPYQPSHGSVFAAIESLATEPPASRRDAAERMREHLQEEAVVQFLLLSLRRAEDGHYRWRFNARGLRDSYAQLLEAPREGSYPGPTLFVYGALSSYVDEGGSKAARRRFPAAEFVSIGDTGHWLHAEKPTEFNASVRNFLLRYTNRVSA